MELAPEGAINAKRRGSDHESASKPQRPTTAARVFAQNSRSYLCKSSALMRPTTSYANL